MLKIEIVHKIVPEIVPEIVSEIFPKIFPNLFSKNWINEIENMTPKKFAKSQPLQEKHVTSFLIFKRPYLGAQPIVNLINFFLNCFVMSVSFLVKKLLPLKT